MKLLIVLTLAITGPAMAANKCTLPNGKVEYSDVPCSSAARTQEIRPVENSIDTSGARAQGETTPQPQAQSSSGRQSGRLPNEPDPCPSNSQDNLATPGQDQAAREHMKCLQGMAKKRTAPLFFK